MQGLKDFLNKHSFILNITSLIYRFLFAFRKKIRGKNYINYKGVFMKKCKLEIYGDHNEVKIEPLTRMSNCHIFIKGDYNCIRIGREVYGNKLEIWVEDSKNVVEIGKGTVVIGNTHLAVTEGTRLRIGEGSLLSTEITMRTGDSHSILIEGRRINQASDITIGNHVWIGNKVILLKGVNIGNNSVIGTGSVVTKKFGDGVIIAGVPAKIIKEKIYWKNERI